MINCNQHVCRIMIKIIRKCNVSLVRYFVFKKSKIIYSAGWGMSTRETLDIQTHLLEARVNIFSDSICEKIFSPFDLWDAQKSICSMGSSGEGSCHGDAGGPVICVDSKNEPILVGIQKKRKTCGGPFLITKTAAYVDFIRNLISARALTKCGPPERSFDIADNVKIECQGETCHLGCYITHQIPNLKMITCQINNLSNGRKHFRLFSIIFF